MKVLSNRTKIAAAINFSQYPVIRIDLSKTDLYGVVGAPVRIDNGTFTTGEPYFVRGYLRTFKDENVLTFDAGGVALKANLSYSDYERMLEYTNAPIVKPDQDILVCMVDSERRLVYDPVVLRTGKRVDPYCMTPLDLERCKIPAAEEVEHQEWGLVMVTPQAVVEEADGLGKPRAIGRNEVDMDTLGARQKGYRDGLKFDPNSRLEGRPERAQLASCR